MEQQQAILSLQPLISRQIVEIADSAPNGAARRAALDATQHTVLGWTITHIGPLNIKTNNRKGPRNGRPAPHQLQFSPANIAITMHDTTDGHRAGPGYSLTIDPDSITCISHDLNGGCHIHIRTGDPRGRTIRLETAKQPPQEAVK